VLALVIGFKANFLGLVTSSFTPVVFTVVGTTPKIPDAVIDDLISFAENSEEFAELIACNRSEAEAVMEELLSAEDQEEGSLVCN